MKHLSEDDLLDLAAGLESEADPHLDSCAACAARLQSLREEQEELRGLFAEEAELPSGFSERIGATVAAAVSVPVPQTSRSARMKRLALASVVLLTAGACTWYAMVPPDPESPPTAQLPAGASLDSTAIPIVVAGTLIDNTLGGGQPTGYQLVDGSGHVIINSIFGQPSTKTLEFGGLPRIAHIPALRLPADADATWSEGPGNERYGTFVENRFVSARSQPLSTFSIDVDRAAYANTRRYLEDGLLPPADAVRIEELLNYFSYQDPAPAADAEHPLSIHVESASCPWQEGQRIVRIALKGKEMEQDSRPGSNLVFLIDVSGSMGSQNKLPLVQKALKLLVNKLDERDSISMIVYAGAAGQVLETTSGEDKETIHAAIGALSAGGSTNGGQGIELAYRVARENFVEGGINRVILCTDGDFNVGVSDIGALTRMVEEKAQSGVFLSLLGFGTGNLNDALLESLSNRGNGMYAYIDSFKEAAKVFSRELLGSLWTIAKDVKLQIEFNPAFVGAYRLIGYENRMLAAEDFKDDTVDAGDLGVGHSVCALYQIAPPGEALDDLVDTLKYSDLPALPADPSPELLTVKLRYKAPDSDTSQLLEVAHIDTLASLDEASEDLQFNTAVAAFGLILRGSRYAGSATMAGAIELGDSARSYDPGGDREAFVALARRARELLEARGAHEVGAPEPRE